ncbi:hypothetical protein BB560_002061, partial [Smittium megazygosporum]
SGISLKAEASKFLVECIENAQQDVNLAAEWLENVAFEWMKTENQIKYIAKPLIIDSSLLVELDDLKKLLKRISQHSIEFTEIDEKFSAVDDIGPLRKEIGVNFSDFSSKLDEKKFFKVMSAYETPQLWYDPSRGQFLKPELAQSYSFTNSSTDLLKKSKSSLPSQNPQKTKYSGLVTSSESKVELFKQRYDIIRQKLQRNDTHLRESQLGNTWDGKIDTVGSLKGREGQNFVIFGMLTQLEEGLFFLEDKDQSIKLNFSEINTINFTNEAGVITQDSFILVEGTLNDDTFLVKNLIQPPPETRSNSLSYFKGANFSGDLGFLQDQITLEAIEGLDDNGAIVFLSDVWLDKPEVLDRLQKLFKGFSASRIPLAFIFLGNFCSEPYVPGSNTILDYQRGFEDLSRVILEYSEISKECYFVFIPGPGDPWGLNAFPYPPIPKFITERFQNKIRRSIFTTNPTRIYFCTQEIVVFRDDLIKKMRRNSVVCPDSEIGSFEEKIVKTVINQSHLSPLPTRINPVFWGYDHCLRLFPSPTLLVLADKYEPYNLVYNEVLAMNPGSFALNGFKFMVYLPSNKSVQISQIPAE